MAVPGGSAARTSARFTSRVRKLAAVLAHQIAVGQVAIRKALCVKPVMHTRIVVGNDQPHDIVVVHFRAGRVIAHGAVQKIHAAGEDIAHTEDPEAVVIVDLDDQRLVGFSSQIMCAAIRPRLTWESELAVRSGGNWLIKAGSHTPPQYRHECSGQSRMAPVRIHRPSQAPRSPVPESVSGAGSQCQGARSRRRLGDELDVLGVGHARSGVQAPAVATGFDGAAALTAMLSEYSSAAKLFTPRVEAGLYRPVDSRSGSAVEIGERQTRQESPADRRHIEHPAAFAFTHCGNGQLGEVQRRQHVHLHHQAHPLVRDLVERTQERHRCVVHQNFRRANAFDDLGEEPFPILGFRQIGAPPAIADPPLAAISSQSLLKRSLVFGILFHGAGSERDCCSLSGQSLGDRFPETPAACRVTSATLPAQRPVNSDSPPQETEMPSVKPRTYRCPSLWPESERKPSCIPQAYANGCLRRCVSAETGLTV